MTGKEISELACNRLRGAGALHGVRKADGLEHPDEIPADVGLIPTKAKTSRASMSVVILMPVFAPGGNLKRAEPPDIYAGIAFFGFAEMREAVHKALHMQRVDEAHGPHPEESHPAETKNRADEKRKDDNGSFRVTPKLVNTPGKFRSPALLVGWRRLIKPAKMRPPEAALLGAGNVVWGVGYRVMQAMIGDPAGGMSRAIEDRPENKELFDKPIYFESLVSKQAVVADRSAQATEGDEQQAHAKNLKAGNRKQDQANERERVNNNEKSEHAFFSADRFPEGPLPRTRFLRGTEFHVVSNELNRRAALRRAGTKPEGQTQQ
jgi:hypothetical protein